MLSRAVDAMTGNLSPVQKAIAYGSLIMVMLSAVILGLYVIWTLIRV